MNAIIKNIDKRPDLAILSIQAAEELERKRLGLAAEMNSVDLLYRLLTTSFKEQEEGTYPLDYAMVFSSALTNIGELDIASKPIPELAKDALEMAQLLNPVKIKQTDLPKLVSFCVALSDSAALYKRELEEMRKNIA